MEGSKQGCANSDWLCSLAIPGVCVGGLERLELEPGRQLLERLAQSRPFAGERN